VIAHPDSPKEELRWRGPAGALGAAADGVEWLNVDSEWRDESIAHLAATFGRYLVRPPETIASLLQRPAQTVRRWDGAGRARATVGLAALDAHARLPWRARQYTAANDAIVAFPSYRQMFGTIAQAVVLDRPLSGDAAADGQSLLAALRAGATF